MVKHGIIPLKYLMAKLFQRKIEDFICGNCGYRVTGNGYTNHCPKCLYSRHVDIRPGDRQNRCRGLMSPIGLEIKAGEYILIHKCLKCGELKKNKTAGEDNHEALIKLAKATAG